MSTPTESIERNFRDPNTGQVNREQLNTFEQGIEDENLDPRLKDFWVVQEQEIIKDRLASKIGNLVAKSLFMPNLTGFENVEIIRQVFDVCSV